MRNDVEFTIFNSREDTRVLEKNRKKMAWSKLVEAMRTPKVIANKADAKLISGCTFALDTDPVTQWRPAFKNGMPVYDGLKPFVGRNNESVRDRHLLLLDYDGSATLKEFHAFHKEFEWFAYTSYNHLADGVTHKFRVVIPLYTSVSKKAVDERRDTLIKVFGIEDTTCLTHCQAMYLPSCHPDRADLFKTYHNEGKLFSLDRLKAKAIEPPKKPTKQFNTNIKKLEQALELIDASDYNNWIKVTFAIANEQKLQDEDLEQIWLDWCATADNYDEKACQKLWTSAMNKTVSQPITLGSVYNMAYENGFTWQSGLVLEF